MKKFTMSALLALAGLSACNAPASKSDASSAVDANGDGPLLREAKESARQERARLREAERAADLPDRQELAPDVPEYTVAEKERIRSLGLNEKDVREAERTIKEGGVNVTH